MGGPFCLADGLRRFSVSESSATRVIRYIEEQDEHHKKVSFQDEYLGFLKRHRVDYDPRFLWD